MIVFWDLTSRLEEAIMVVFWCWWWRHDRIASRKREQMTLSARTSFSCFLRWTTSLSVKPFTQGLPKQKKVDTFIYIIRPRVVHPVLWMVRFWRSCLFCDACGWVVLTTEWNEWTNRRSHRHSPLLTPSLSLISPKGFTRLYFAKQQTTTNQSFFCVKNSVVFTDRPVRLSCKSHA